ncbi:MAG TPA: AAA family ATPase, partial [Chitinophagaceae bacterium]
MSSHQLIAKPPYVYTATEILELGITETPMLCSPILPKAGIAALCGSSDGGKSYLCLTFAMAICSESESVLGFRINKQHGSVIIVCTEDSKEDICARIRKMMGGKKLNEGKLRFIFDTENM